MKEKVLKYIRITLSIILGIYIPLFGIMVLFMLGGDNKKGAIIIALGLTGLLIGNILSYKRAFGWFIFCIGLIVFYLGTYQDKQFWRQENLHTCKELKTNPSCQFSVTGIYCSNHPVGTNFGFSAANFCDNN